MISHPPTRRGVALLLALATLLISTTAVVTLVRLAATTKTQHHYERNTLAAYDLLDAAEGPIHHWLQNESSEIVLPPDNEQPRVPILHDAWTTNEQIYELQITGFDLCGMVPWTLLSRGSPFRLALPYDFLPILDRVDLRRHDHPGLDLLTLHSDQTLHIFPTAEPSIPLIFDDTMPTNKRSKKSIPSKSNQAVALGALVATHTNIRKKTDSPFQDQQIPDRQGIRLNVNTAPEPILKAGLRSLHRGGLDQILKSREKGELATVPDPPPDEEANSSPRTIIPATTSDAWAFRIDTRVGPVRQSWWAVYVANSSLDSWECVQRLIIHE